MRSALLAVALLAQGPYGPPPVQAPLVGLPAWSTYYVTTSGCIVLPLGVVHTHREGRNMLMVEAVDPTCDYSGRFYVLEATVPPVGWRTLR